MQWRNCKSKPLISTSFTSHWLDTVRRCKRRLHRSRIRWWEDWTKIWKRSITCSSKRHLCVKWRRIWRSRTKSPSFRSCSPRSKRSWRVWMSCSLWASFRKKSFGKLIRKYSWEMMTSLQWITSHKKTWQCCSSWNRGPQMKESELWKRWLMRLWMLSAWIRRN